MPNPQKPSRCGAAGVVVRSEKNGGTKLSRTKGKRWSQQSERVFLAELAATCNVTAAAEAAGFSTTAIYNQRKKRPGFAEAWLAAIDEGYASLEALLIERAVGSLREPVLRKDQHERDSGGAEGQPVAAAPREPVKFSEALNLLRLHRSTARGGAPQNYRGREKAPDMEAIRASILLKIEAIERVDARKDRLRSQRRGGAEAGRGDK